MNTIKGICQGRFGHPIRSRGGIVAQEQGGELRAVRKRLGSAIMCILLCELRVGDQARPRK